VPGPGEYRPDSTLGIDQPDDLPSSRAQVGTAQHVAHGNNLATALAMSPQHDYNMSSLCQVRKCFNFREFRRHCNVLPMPRLGRPPSFR
jgi:hypothetical protein